MVGVRVFSPKYKSNNASATFASSIVYDTSSGNVVSAEIEICRNNELVESLSMMNMLSMIICEKNLTGLIPSIYNAQHGDGEAVVPLFPIVLFQKTFCFFKENRSHVKDFLPKQTCDEKRK